MPLSFSLFSSVLVSSSLFSLCIFWLVCAWFMLLTLKLAVNRQNSPTNPRQCPMRGAPQTSQRVASHCKCFASADDLTPSLKKWLNSLSLFSSSSRNQHAQNAQALISHDVNFCQTDGASRERAQEKKEATRDSQRKFRYSRTSHVDDRVDILLCWWRCWCE